MEKVKPSVKLTIFSTFVLLASVTALVALSVHYYFSSNLARQGATNQFIQIAETITEKVEQYDQISKTVTEILVATSVVEVPITESGPHPVIPLMGSALKSNKNLYAIHLGTSDDRYLQLTNLDISKQARDAFKASPQDRWLELRVVPSDSGLIMIKRYLDADFNLRLQIKEASQFAASDRPWFKLAQYGRVSKSPPYMFSFYEVPGVSYSYRTQPGSVMGISFALGEMIDSLSSESYMNGIEAFLFDERGFVTGQQRVNADRPEVENITVDLTDQEIQFIQQNPEIFVSNELDYPPFDFSVGGAPKGYFPELISKLAKNVGLKVSFVNGLSFSQLYESFKNGELDVLQTVRKNTERSEIGLFSDPFIDSSIVAVTKQESLQNIHNLEQLRGMRIATAKDFLLTKYLSLNFPEYNYIPVRSALEGLKAVASGNADVYLEMDTVVQYFRKYHFIEGLKLSSPLKVFERPREFDLHVMVAKDNALLLQIINKSYASLSSNYKQQLADKWLSLAQFDQTQKPQINVGMGQLPYAFLLDLAKDEKRINQLHDVTLDGREYFAYSNRIFTDLNAASSIKEYMSLLVPKENVTKPYFEKVYMATAFSITTLFLLLPVILYLVKLIVQPIALFIGQTQQIKKRQFKQLSAVDSNIKELSELSMSMESMVESLGQFEEQQNELFDEFVAQVATTVEQGISGQPGHCDRVNSLSTMLLKAASSNRELPFAEFESDPEQIKQMRLATYLIECGKISVPNHLFHKASKLEMVYNRIHEVRMRFEVLWRDAEIQYWQELTRTPENKKILDQWLADQISSIKHDFSFIASCNVGTKIMSEDVIERLSEIGKLKWIRKLDNSLGVSEGNIDLSGTAGQGPVVERLLTSNNHYNDVQQITSDVPADIKQDNELDKSEIYNLLVESGVHTAQEKNIMNGHFVTSLNILKTLQFPEHLAEVNTYVSYIYEKMNCVSEPETLSEQQQTISSSILCIAEIFASLTSKTAANKKPKTLSQIIATLHTMSIEGRINAHVFKLMLSTGIYETYAEKYMAPHQRDRVDVNRYLQ